METTLWIIVALQMILIFGLFGIVVAINTNTTTITRLLNRRIDLRRLLGSRKKRFFVGSVFGLAIFGLAWLPFGLLVTVILGPVPIVMFFESLLRSTPIFYDDRVYDAFGAVTSALMWGVLFLLLFSENRTHRRVAYALIAANASFMFLYFFLGVLPSLL